MVNTVTIIIIIRCSFCSVLQGYSLTICANLKGVSLHRALRAAWFLEAVMSPVSGGWHVYTMIGQTMSTTGRCFVRQRSLPDGSQAWACTAKTPHLSFVTWRWWRVNKPSWCGECAGHRRGLAESEWNLPLIQTYVRGPWATMRFTRYDTLNKRCRRLSG